MLDKFQQQQQEQEQEQEQQQQQPITRMAGLKH